MEPNVVHRWRITRLNVEENNTAIISSGKTPPKVLCIAIDHGFIFHSLLWYWCPASRSWLSLSIPTPATVRDDDEFAILTVKGDQFILRDKRKRVRTHDGIHSDEWFRLWNFLGTTVVNNYVFQWFHSPWTKLRSAHTGYITHLYGCDWTLEARPIPDDQDM